MWYMKLKVTDGILSMLAKRADMLSLEIWSIKKISPVRRHFVECCCTTYNFELDYLDAFCGVEKLMTKKNDLHQKVETATNYARRVPKEGNDIKILVQKQKI